MGPQVAGVPIGWILLGTALLIGARETALWARPRAIRPRLVVVAFQRCTQARSVPVDKPDHVVRVALTGRIRDAGKVGAFRCRCAPGQASRDPRPLEHDRIRRPHDTTASRIDELSQ